MDTHLIIDLLGAAAGLVTILSFFGSIVSFVWQHRRRKATAQPVAGQPYYPQGSQQGYAQQGYQQPYSQPAYPQQRPKQRGISFGFLISLGLFGAGILSCTVAMCAITGVLGTLIANENANAYDYSRYNNQLPASTGGAGSITVINSSAATLCYIVIEPSGTTNSTGYQLNPQIPPGGSEALPIVAGTWDVGVADCYGNTVGLQANIPISSGQQVSLTVTGQ
jgi:hypothetical protein